MMTVVRILNESLGRVGPHFKAIWVFQYYATNTTSKMFTQSDMCRNVRKNTKDETLKSHSY